jgi:hypothetical protein
MPYQNIVFINLPVTDVDKSAAFYKALGLVANKTFSNKDCAMVSLPLAPDTNPHESPIKIMLLGHTFFQTFVPPDRKIGDPNSTVQSIICFSRESREAVDEFVAKAKEAGGTTDIREKTDMEKMMEEHGMYGAA